MWDDVEPTFSIAVASFFDALVKAYRRSKLVVVPWLLVSVAVFFYLKSVKPTYMARVTFRAREGFSSIPASALQDFIKNTVFTQDRLIPIIQEHELYTVFYKRAPYLAVAEFREEIEVDVIRYQLADKTVSEETPSGMRVSVKYLHGDSNVAQSVVRQLADLIQATSREASVKRLSEDAAEAAAGADLLTGVIRPGKNKPKAPQAAPTALTNGLRIAYRRAGPTANPASVEREQELDKQLADALRTRTAAEIEASLLEREHTMSFEILDNELRIEKQRPILPVNIALSLVVGATVAAVLALLLGVGTGVIADAADVQAAGLPVAATVPMPSPWSRRKPEWKPASL